MKQIGIKSMFEKKIGSKQEQKVKSDVDLNQQDGQNNRSKKFVIEDDNEEKLETQEQIIVAPTPKIQSQNNPLNKISQSEEIIKIKCSEQNIPKASNVRNITDKNFNALKDSPFENNEDIPFSFVCSTLDAVEECSGAQSKEVMKDLVSKMFRAIILKNKTQLIPTFYFCILKLSPDYEQSELGIGNTILIKCISRVSGRTDKQIRDNQATLGDLGLVAEKSKSSQTTVDKFFTKKDTKAKISPLTIKEVMDVLLKVSKTKGLDSTNEKERLIEQLLRKAQPNETRYIVRFIEKNLKIGAAEKTMQAALAKAFYIESKVNQSQNQDQEYSLNDFEFHISRALCECPNYDLIINTLMSIGQKLNKYQRNNISTLLKICHIQTGVPCKPMLAKPMKSIQMIFHRFENIKFTCEYKYDGLRGQIHYSCEDGGKISIFSRNLEDMTQAYPDVVTLVQEYIAQNQHIKNFIMDSEIVAFDVKSQRILPFQVLSTRARKNVESSSIEVQVCLYMFDLLFFNNSSLLQTPFIKRRNILREYFIPIIGKLAFAESQDSDSFEEIEEFLLASIKIGCEGLMIKTLETNAEYEPAKRSMNWLKLKKDYLDNGGLGDTFDLVPIGALHGSGKRKGLYGSYLLACYNEDMEIFETICKIGTGFSDEQLDRFHNLMQDNIIQEPLRDYKCEGIKMDVWFKPAVVWEVKGADLQQSPVYFSCQTLLNQNRGLGLRFPRLIKIREDKKPEEASTSQFIYDIYNQQAVVKNQLQFNDQEEDIY